MLSGSRLPPPTFRVQVTMPLCVTDMMRLATEHAFSCRVASTMWRWPTCEKQDDLSACIKHSPCYDGWRTRAYFAQGHYTRDILYIDPHAIIWVIWQLYFLPSFVIRWYENFGYSVRQNQYKNCCQITHLQPKQPTDGTSLTLCWKELPWYLWKWHRKDFHHTGGAVEIGLCETSTYQGHISPTASVRSIWTSLKTFCLPKRNGSVCVSLYWKDYLILNVFMYVFTFNHISGLHQCTHQHINIQYPAVFSWTDTQPLQVYAVFVVKDSVQSITYRDTQLFTTSALKLRSCICRTNNKRWEIEKTINSWCNKTSFRIRWLKMLFFFLS